MADDKVYNEDYMEEEPKLFFQWRTNAFIPYLKLDNADQSVRIREEFNVRFWAKVPEKYVNEYRCVPEYLLDMGWSVAVENAVREPAWAFVESYMERSFPKDRFDMLVQSEGLLYLIEKKFLQWARKGTKELEKLDTSQEDFREIEWQEEAEICKKLLRQDGVYQPEDAYDIKEMADKFVNVKQADSRRDDLRKLAKKLSSMTLMDIDILLQNNSPDIRDFCEKLLDFIFNLVWRKHDDGLYDLWKEIVEAQEKLIECWPWPEDKYNEYQNKNAEFKKIVAEKHIADMLQNLWHAIQHAMDMISDVYECHVTEKLRMTSSGTESIAWKKEGFFVELEKLYDLIKKQAKAMKITGNKKALETYTHDKGRCTAILSDKKHRYISFSGFMDAQDVDILNFLGSIQNDEVLDAFQRISQQMEMELVTMEAGVGKELYWYSVGKKLDFVRRNNLQSELDEWKKKGRGVVGKFQHSYACCERKLLAYLKMKGIRMSDDILLIVKFMPCMHCHAALLRWDRKAALTVWYPELA